MTAEKSPAAWAMTPLKRYAEFSGRSSRAEFWWFMLFLFIAFMVIWFALVGSMAGLAAGSEPGVGALGALGGGMIIIGLLSLAILIPSIAVQVRRLHDTNRSGWWLGGYYLLYALYFVLGISTFMSAATDPTAAAPPNMGAFGATMIVGLALFVYFIILLVFYCLPGTPGPNNYGPDPYGGHDNLEGVFS